MTKEITDMIKQVRDSFLALSVVLAVYGIVERFFLPKKTEIIVEEGIPAELTVLGKKGNPKAVYVSSKKHNLNMRGALIFGLFAFLIQKVVEKLEKDDVTVIE